MEKPQGTDDTSRQGQPPRAGRSVSQNYLRTDASTSRNLGRPSFRASEVPTTPPPEYREFAAGFESPYTRRVSAQNVNTQWTSPPNGDSLVEPNASQPEEVVYFAPRKPWGKTMKGALIIVLIVIVIALAAALGSVLVSTKKSDNNSSSQNKQPNSPGASVSGKGTGSVTATGVTISISPTQASGGTGQGNGQGTISCGTGQGQPSGENGTASRPTGGTAAVNGRAQSLSSCRTVARRRMKLL